MRVRIIPEDHTNDRYILEPLFKSLLQSLGKPRANVKVCQPRLRGYNNVTNFDLIREIVEPLDGMVDIFVLCVDQDGDPERRQRLNQIESKFGQKKSGRKRNFLAVCAKEELETWVLAGLDKRKNWRHNWRWNEIRHSANVKEEYFDIVVEDRDVADNPGKGRDVLGMEAARQVNNIRNKCREDFDNLAQRLKKIIQEQ